MNNLQLIGQSITSLHELSKKEIVFLDDVPRQFKIDLQNFIMGETLSVQEGKVRIGNNLYKKWFSKVLLRGFDYDIDWRK